MSAIKKEAIQQLEIDQPANYVPTGFMKSFLIGRAFVIKQVAMLEIMVANHATPVMLLTIGLQEIFTVLAIFLMAMLLIIANAIYAMQQSTL